MSGINSPKSTHGSQAFRTEIIKKLQDGNFHSGETLASVFNVSRSAISNHIKAINDLGLEIYSVKGRGYKLAADIELLSHNQIISALPNVYQNKAQLVRVENVVSSTNDLVKVMSQGPEQVDSGYCCLAEAQSSGRGRRGKAWVSPYASSLYFSMLWRFASGYQAMAGLSLMVGVVVNDTLNDLGIKDCRLKWPNDIYHGKQKLAGILIEVEGQIGASVSAIIGIGVNIHLPESVEGIDQAFTDLHSIIHTKVSRNKFAALLIEKLWQALPLFEKNGMSPFMTRWKDADLYYNQPVQLIAGKNVTKGISKGIDQAGALLLEIDGKVETFHGGEISVRPA
jgi:BirA family biotin operon repressor/biotin-[acetyl-CoA-carboxylase] ligase